MYRKFKRKPHNISLENKHSTYKTKNMSLIMIPHEINLTQKILKFIVTQILHGKCSQDFDKGSSHQASNEMKHGHWPSLMKM